MFMIDRLVVTIMESLSYALTIVVIENKEKLKALNIGNQVNRNK